MFTDPLTITVNALGQNLPRIKMGISDSTYRTSDEKYTMRISHQTAKKRTRRMIRLDSSKIAVDPLSTLNLSVTAGVYFVIDEPTVGFTDGELTVLVQALASYVGVAANCQKLLGSEY